MGERGRFSKVSPDGPDWGLHLAFQTSLGIDIGRRSLSVAYVKASVRGVRLGAHAVYPFEEERTAEEKVDLIGDLMRDFLKKNRISPTAVFLGIPRDAVVLRYTELPLAVKENLRESLGYEMEKYVPFSPDEIYFDFQIMAEERESGKMRLALVAAKKSSVAPYFAVAERLGVRLSSIEISSTAVANYFAYDTDKGGEASQGFLFLRHDDLELGLLKGGLLHYSRLLRRPAGEVDERAFLAEGLKILRRVWGDHQGRLKTVLCVPESDAGFIDFFKEDEGIEVCLPDLSKAGLPSSAMIPAYGLALKGVMNLPMEINLLPRELRKRSSKIGYYSMFLLVGLFILSAVAWGGSAVFKHKLALDSLDAELKKLGAEVTRIDRGKKACQRLVDRINYLNTLRQGDTPILNVIKELSERIPESAWVSSLTFSDKGVELEGQAASASELISLLDASPFFHDVVFLSAITKTRDGKEKFRIGLKLG